MTSSTWKRAISMDEQGGRLPPAIDLYWIPLGAGAQVVRVSGRIETAARVEARKPLQLYLGVALRADRVALRLEGRLVLPMAVEAYDAGSRHLALLERAIFEHLVQDLPIVKVDVPAEQVRREMIEKSLAWPVAVEKLCPSRMAAQAHILVGRSQVEVNDRLRTARLGPFHVLRAATVA